MKVLLVHNFYGSSAPSGENGVFLAERDLLIKNGHEVVEFTRHSDEIRDQGLRGMIRGAFATPWNLFARKDLGDLIRRERPEVMHVHNPFPLLSPSVFHATAGTDTATVFSLHNYRIFCPNAMLMRDGGTCSVCLDRKNVCSSLRYGCYRNSRLATLPLALSVALHRKLGTWSKRVDAFITLTRFQRDMVVRAGLPADRVFVKPNFYPEPPSPLAWEARENRAVFVGRLSAEKGVQFLVRAWNTWGAAAPALDIIGDGPDRASLENEAAGGTIRFRGQQPFDKAQELLSRSRMLILPSVCYEGFPLVIREAFALGVPVAASRIGSLPHIVDDGKNGVLFDPGDAGDLLSVVRKAWTDGTLETMSLAARVKFEREYTAGENYKILMGIYEHALARRTESRFMTKQATEAVLGYDITAKTCADCVDEIMGWLDGSDHARYLACANPHSLEVARGDADFASALRSADMLVPDGIGIVLASRINGGNIRQRVTGSDIYREVNAALNRRGKASVFFLGSTPATLSLIRERMALDYPAVRVAGAYAPPFRTEFSEREVAEMVDAVNAARPDVFWVGMSAPKQEKWIFRNRGRLNARFIGAVGAVFDFYTGNVRRSHPLFQRMGLEWLPRLLREPRRLWRRNFVSNPLFLARVVAERLRRGRKQAG